MTFELGWKTIKDYLESQGLEVKFPREVIQQAFAHQVITEGELWLEMLANRNQLRHIYNHAQTEAALTLIQQKYAATFEALSHFFTSHIPNA